MITAVVTDEIVIVGGGNDWSSPPEEPVKQYIEQMVHRLVYFNYLLQTFYSTATDLQIRFLLNKITKIIQSYLFIN